MAGADRHLSVATSDIVQWARAFVRHPSPQTERFEQEPQVQSFIAEEVVQIIRVPMLPKGNNIYLRSRYGHPAIIGERVMRKFLLGTVAMAALIAGPATAADLGVRRVVAPRPVPVFTWTGFYVGINTSGSIGVSSTTDTGVFVAPPAGITTIGTNVIFNESFRHAPTGWVFGGQVGYNWQWTPNIVVGLEADWQWTSQKDTVSVGGCNSQPTLGFFVAGSSAFTQCLTDEQKLTNFGTARARGGVVFNESLWYVTGGVAWGTVKDSFIFAGTCNPAIGAAFCPVAAQPFGPFLPAAAAFSHTKTGWTIGGGVETRLWGSGWLLKLEYLYVDLGSVTDSFGVAVNPAFFGPAIAAASAFPVTNSYRFTDNIVRVGLNYKFF